MWQCFVPIHCFPITSMSSETAASQIIFKAKKSIYQLLHIFRNDSKNRAREFVSIFSFCMQFSWLIFLSWTISIICNDFSKIKKQSDSRERRGNKESLVRGLIRVLGHELDSLKERKTLGILILYVKGLCSLPPTLPKESLL